MAFLPTTKEQILLENTLSFFFLQTYISDVIIAINPFTTLSNYTQEVSPSTTEQFITVEINYNLSKYKILLKLLFSFQQHDLYHKCRSQTDEEPHIYWIAEKAYRWAISADNF